jgi:hypothetical protein
MPETTTDRIVEEIVKICRDVKDKTWQGQIKALWKVFNIMTAFIKGQANLIAAMDSKIKRQDQEIAAIRKELGNMKLPVVEAKKPLVS